MSECRLQMRLTIYKCKKRQHILYFAAPLFFYPNESLVRTVPLRLFLIDRTIFQRLCLMRLHHPLSRDQQLTDFTVSPVRILMLISLRYVSVVEAGTAEPSHLHQHE